MIQLAEDISYMESRKVPLDPTLSKILIEVASNRKIDVAVVDAKQLKEFDDSDTGDEADIDWIENTRSYDTVFDFPDGEKRYLLFWSSNEKGDAIVAYKVTPIK
jgi:hypothetical protein